MHTNDAMKAGETTQRLFGVAAWREAPWYTDAERAALELTDAATTLGPAGVPDDVWHEAAENFDEKALADLVGAIAMANLRHLVEIGKASCREKVCPAVRSYRVTQY